ncbi:MAG: hypothetical protein KDE04_10775 [Anaerolineales bacterium]|nr:hypothetical protein [Anaerolineales bacterium]
MTALTISRKKDMPDLLASQVADNEQLRHWALVYVGPGGVGLLAVFGLLGELIASASRSWFYVGLTDRRLLLIDKRSAEVSSFKLEEVNTLIFSRSGGWLSSSVPGLLQVDLIDRTLELKAKQKQHWQSAKQMAAAFKQLKLTAAGRPQVP